MNSDEIVIQFEGRDIPARRGESLAAALTGNGETVFRSTRLGHSRGQFCGMGVCQDCLVEIDGAANQRACMTKIDRPMQVRREAHLRPPAVPASPRAVHDLRRETPDVLVIGAGPGGLSAAIAARRAGAQVTLLDERPAPGGQYYKQLGVTDGPPADRQHLAGKALIDTALKAGVDIRSGTLVWGAFQPGEFTATSPDGPLSLAPRVAIVATGAYERPWPVPGWTLPGVMTTGAAQTLWRTARRLPGKRILIAGNGPLNLQLAAELLSGGAEVIAVAEAAAQPGLGQIGDLATLARLAPGLVAEGLRYEAARRRAGVPILYGAVVASIETGATGLRVVLSPADGGAPTHHFEADVICIGYGFEPANELLRVLGCAHDWDERRRQLITRRDASGRTSHENVYALGDCTGLGGAKLALAEGTIAGFAAAEQLGSTLSAEALKQRDAARAAQERHRRFQAALWRVYAAAPFPAALVQPETLVCRCEEVSFGEVETALAEGMTGIGSVKRRTRLGMGRCQGRYCAPVIDAMLAARSGGERHELSGFAPRVPVRPVPIGDLAAIPTDPQL